MARKHSGSEPSALPPSTAELEFPDEGSLLAALRAGNRRAAEELVERTHQMVYASLFKLTGGDAALAEDLSQDCYAKAWKALDDFDGRARLSTWLYRIAYNIFLNHVRRPALIRPFEEGETETLADSERPPALRAEQREQADRLRKSILELPEDLRFAITARYWAEMPVREIATQQGITVMGVRKRLRRAEAALRVALQMSEENDP